jgi:hypothetical protein
MEDYYVLGFKEIVLFLEHNAGAKYASIPASCPPACAMSHLFASLHSVQIYHGEYGRLILLRTPPSYRNVML